MQREKEKKETVMVVAMETSSGNERVKFVLKRRFLNQKEELAIQQRRKTDPRTEKRTIPYLADKFGLLL